MTRKGEVQRVYSAVEKSFRRRIVGQESLYSEYWIATARRKGCKSWPAVIQEVLVRTVCFECVQCAFHSDCRSYFVSNVESWFRKSLKHLKKNCIYIKGYLKFG